MEPAVVLRSVAPVFSTTDVARWLDHYRALGFDVEAHDAEYGSPGGELSCSTSHGTPTTTR